MSAQYTCISYAKLLWLTTAPPPKGTSCQEQTQLYCNQNARGFLTWHDAWRSSGTQHEQKGSIEKLAISKGTNWNQRMRIPKGMPNCPTCTRLAPSKLVRSFGDLQASADASNVPQPTEFGGYSNVFRCLQFNQNLVINMAHF